MGLNGRNKYLSSQGIMGIFKETGDGSPSPFFRDRDTEDSSLSLFFSDIRRQRTVPRLFNPEKGFMPGEIFIRNDRIEKVEYVSDPGACSEKTSVMYILPGLIDIHTHGNMGCDFSDGDPEKLIKMGRYYAEHGITSFAPASMTLPYEILEKAFRVAAEYKNNYSEKHMGISKLCGIHMEGPFLSNEKRGAQKGDYLKLPDADAFMGLQKSSRCLIRIVDIAPELPGSEEFIRKAAACSKVSIAHTGSSYEETMAAFEAGASHVTHLFNAMPPLHHRCPGVIGAAYDMKNVTVELICDGLHVHPSMVRLAFNMFPGRICLVSDSIRCCGMPDGRYELGDQIIIKKDKEARLDNGSLAGACTNLYEDMVKAISFGVPVYDAVTAASLTPAKVLGIDSEVGSLQAGKKADFIVCDENWNIQKVFIDGELYPFIFEKNSV